MLSRVRQFIPTIQAANQELLQKIQASVSMFDCVMEGPCLCVAAVQALPEGALDIENVDEESGASVVAMVGSTASHACVRTAQHGLA